MFHRPIHRPQISFSMGVTAHEALHAGWTGQAREICRATCCRSGPCQQCRYATRLSCRLLRSSKGGCTSRVGMKLVFQAQQL